MKMMMMVVVVVVVVIRCGVSDAFPVAEADSCQYTWTLLPPVAC